MPWRNWIASPRAAAAGHFGRDQNSRFQRAPAHRPEIRRLQPPRAGQSKRAGLIDLRVQPQSRLAPARGAAGAFRDNRAAETQPRFDAPAVSGRAPEAPRSAQNPTLSLANLISESATLRATRNRNHNASRVFVMTARVSRVRRASSTRPAASSCAIRVI